MFPKAAWFAFVRSRVGPRSFVVASVLSASRSLRSSLSAGSAHHSPGRAAPGPRSVRSVGAGLTTRSSEQAPAGGPFLLFYPLRRRCLSLSLSSLGGTTFTLASITQIQHKTLWPFDAPTAKHNFQTTKLQLLSAVIRLPTPLEVGSAMVSARSPWRLHRPSSASRSVGQTSCPSIHTLALNVAAAAGRSVDYIRPYRLTRRCSERRSCSCLCGCAASRRR